MQVPGRGFGLPCVAMFAALLVLGSFLGSFVPGNRAAAAEPPPPRPLAVTVDDLPIGSAERHRDPRDREAITRGLLAVLAKHRIQAVGLVIGGQISGPADDRLLDVWLEAGHELGNHSYGHLDYTRTPSAEYIADVERGRAELAAYLQRSPAAARRPGGVPPVRFFRFPYLREGDTPEKLQAMRTYLASSGQRNLPVTIDDQDWSYEDAWLKAVAANDRAVQDSVTAAYQQALRLETEDHETRGDGLFERQTPQILLLHANAVGVAQWDRLFTALERSGHRFASVDEVLADSAFAVPHDYVGRYGCSLWHRIADERRRDKVRTAVQALLATSAADWNSGDLEAFCAHYADDALFVGANGVTQGRQAVLDRYKLVLRPRGGGRWEIVQDASM